MGAAWKSFGLLPQLRLPRLLGSPHPFGWRWQGFRDRASAQGQQRGLSLLSRKRLALVELGIGCCLAVIVPTLIFTSCM